MGASEFKDEQFLYISIYHDEDFINLFKGFMRSLSKKSNQIYIKKKYENSKKIS